MISKKILIKISNCAEEKIGRLKRGSSNLLDGITKSMVALKTDELVITSDDISPKSKLSMKRISVVQQFTV